jgi:hypothetical protein
MAARPPPARPHIGINPSHFSSRSDWGIEDDAWDSTSDSESPRQSTHSNTWNSTRTSSTIAPKPVPRSSSSSSSSTLAFSYTHVNAPSSSSYPPKSHHKQPPKNGWTIVRKSHQDRRSIDQREDEEEKDDGISGDVDVEGDMIVGELDPDIAEQPRPSTKPRQEQGSIRDDVDQIVNGTSFSVLHLRLPTSLCRSSAWRTSPSAQMVFGAISSTRAFSAPA